MEAAGTDAGERAAELAVRCAAGARAAIDWLAAKQGPDGLTDGPDAWLYAGHKGLAAFAAGGRSVEAGRLATWLAREQLGSDGDVGNGSNRTGAARSVWLYFNAWITWGAHRAGRFDISLPASRFIASHQKADGSFHSNPHGPEQVVDLFVTAACGEAVLATGNIEAARLAAGALRGALEEQPREDGLTIAWARNREGDAALSGSPERAFVRFGVGERQYYFALGMALVLLARLGLATGDAEPSETAAAYLEPARAMLPGVAMWGQGGKVGWGAALLWQLTGEPAWLDLAERIVGGYLLGTQEADGRWARDDPVVETDTAAEFGFILAEAASALASPLVPPLA